LIEWNHMTATQADALVRACNPIYGGAKCRIMDHTLQVFASSVAAAEANKRPGQILQVTDDAITVACALNTCLKVHTLGTAEGIYHAPQWAARQP
jgi:methionyl-tRNA formyltransferase